MYQTMTQVFSFLIGVLGEALVLRFVNKIRYWWATYVAEEMKAKADADYATLFPSSEDLGRPNPDDDQGTPGTKG